MVTAKYILGDCIQKMQELPDGSIDLIITSPPYNAKKEYGAFNNDNVTLSEWLATIRAFLLQSYRVLSPNSRCCVNLPWVMLRKPQVFVPHHVARIGEELGFYIRDWVIWNKQLSNSTAWGTWMSPSGATLRAVCEPIIVFSKGIGGKKKVTGEGKGKCVVGDCTKEEFLEYTKNVWNFNGTRNKEHPAVFPEELPKRLIKLYSWKGDTVLDPFMGTGTTGMVAAKLERNFIGIEIEPRYYEMAKERINAIVNQSTLNLYPQPTQPRAVE